MEFGGRRLPVTTVGYGDLHVETEEDLILTELKEIRLKLESLESLDSGLASQGPA